MRRHSVLHRLDRNCLKVLLQDGPERLMCIAFQWFSGPVRLEAQAAHREVGFTDSCLQVTSAGAGLEWRPEPECVGDLRVFRRCELHAKFAHSHVHVLMTVNLMTPCQPQPALRPSLPSYPKWLCSHLYLYVC